MTLLSSAWTHSSDALDHTPRQPHPEVVRLGVGQRHCRHPWLAIRHEAERPSGVARSFAAMADEDASMDTGAVRHQAEAIARLAEQPVCEFRSMSATGSDLMSAGDSGLKSAIPI